jgi:hypothetical protein
MRSGEKAAGTQCPKNPVHDERDGLALPAPGDPPSEDVVRYAVPIVLALFQMPSCESPADPASELVESDVRAVRVERSELVTVFLSLFPCLHVTSNSRSFPAKSWKLSFIGKSFSASPWFIVQGERSRSLLRVS